MTVTHRLSARLRQERGFTMFEILIALVILGILAAVALTSLAGKDQLAMDAQTKSDVRNLFSHVQACFVEQEDYTLCDEASELDSPSGVSWGAGAGQVEIRRGGIRTTRSQVTIRGFSEAVTDGQRHQFTFIKRAGPPPDTRTCHTGGSDNAGGCNAGTW